MHVLVTGGAGYIGSVLVPKLVGRGHQVRVLDRMFWGLPHYAGEPGVELVNADVRRLPEGVLDGVDAVDHLAGFSNDPTSEYNPEANWQMNAVATESIARLCRASGVRRLVFGSSCSLYDGADRGDELLDEGAEIVPRGAYAASKRYAEQALLAESGGGFEPVILRQATVFGPSERMRFDLVVNSFVKDALVRQRLILHGGGRMWRPLVSVEDLAEAHVACLEASADVAGETFNVVQDNYQVRHLAELVGAALRALGREVAIEDGPLPSVVRNYRCSGEKLRERLGLAFPTTPAHAVADLIARYGRLTAEQLGHPRYYNIAWMELLESVRPAYQAMPNIFEPLRDD